LHEWDRSNRLHFEQLDSRRLLTRQLEDIAALAGQLKDNLDRPAAPQLYRDLCNRATLHVVARERILLPAWAREGYRELRLDAMVPHGEFKRRLADLMVTAPRATSQFRAALDAFVAAAKAQQQADEEILVPGLRQAIDLDARRLVMEDIDRLYSLGGSAAPTAPEPAPAVARELLQEARVVLSSLPLSAGERNADNQSV
jgi:hypothetical protein